METDFQVMREKICEPSRLLYDRKLTDAAGSNLGARVAEALHKKENAFADLAGCVMAPWHGIFSLGITIDAVYEAVERKDSAATILLKSGVLPAFAPEAPSLVTRAALLKEEIGKYGKSNE